MARPPFVPSPSLVSIALSQFEIPVRPEPVDAALLSPSTFPFDLSLSKDERTV
jgi:hypothetical protein